MCRGNRVWIWWRVTIVDDQSRLDTVACKYMEMGHYNYLIWNHSTNKWYTTTLGGANRPDAKNAYMGWTSSQNIGTDSTIKEWMYKFNQD